MNKTNNLWAVVHVFFQHMTKYIHVGRLIKGVAAQNI